MIVVTLKGEPEGRLQPQPRVVFKGGRPIPLLHAAAKTKRYQRALALQAKVTMGARPLLAGPLQVTVLAVFSIPPSWSRRDRYAALVGTILPTGKPDWDNLGKQLDAFKGVVWSDDASIVDGRVVKRYGEEPLLRIEVRPLDDAGLFSTDKTAEAASPRHIPAAQVY